MISRCAPVETSKGFFFFSFYFSWLFGAEKERQRKQGDPFARCTPGETKEDEGEEDDEDTREINAWYRGEIFALLDQLSMGDGEKIFYGKVIALVKLLLIF